MRVILHIIRKEFLQVLHDKPMLGIIFVIPIIQLFVLGYAITTDIKNVPLTVLDLDQTTQSRAVIQSVVQTKRFILLPPAKRIQEVRRKLGSGETTLALIIPRGFSADLASGSGADLQLIVDGVDSNTALVGSGYARRAMYAYFSKLSGNTSFGEVRVRAVYNPELESKFGIIPGIVAILLTIITTMLTALGLVREREIGTLEQLNVTPIRPIQLIIGKTLPFAFLGSIMVFMAILVSMIWFKIPLRGSIDALAVVTVLYLLTTLGLGLFVSTTTSTQQQSVFLAWFILVTSILMSGFMFPISNMPVFLQKLTYLIPLRYYVTALRAIMLKGAGLTDLAFQCKALLISGSAIFLFSILKFKKRV